MFTVSGTQIISPSDQPFIAKGVATWAAMGEQTGRTDRDSCLEEAKQFLHLADQAQTSSNRGLAIEYLELALNVLDEIESIQRADRATDGESAALGATNNPEHWLDRAQKARTIAEQMSDPVARRTLMGIAEGYLQLAERAAVRGSPES